MPLTFNVMERCFAMFLRLTRGPATTEELMEIVQKFGGENANRDALSKRFEDDRIRLRDFFGCKLSYNHADGYMLESMDRALIDLPPDAMRGLAFLQMTFGDDTTPMSREVQSLVNVMLMLISETGQEETERVRGLIEVDLRQRDEDKIAAKVWRDVEKACAQHRELEFTYLSPGQADGIPRTHRVEPMRCTFNPLRAHYYLEAYCIENSGPYGKIPANTMRPYRLGRILTTQVLPQRFVVGQRRLKSYELVYELKPEISRLGVTRHIADCEIEMKSDGGAIVRARSTDLFFDLQTLLHYGAGCRVLGGEEALKQMRKRVLAMYEVYKFEADTTPTSLSD